MELSDSHCVQKAEKISGQDETTLLSRLEGWSIDNSTLIHKLQKTIKSETFSGAVDLLKKIAIIADSENHHPDFHLYYNKLNIVLYTHRVGGLTINDFIMAAKIDALPTVQ